MYAGGRVWQQRLASTATVDEAPHADSRLMDWLGTDSTVRSLHTSGWTMLEEMPPGRRRYLAEEFRLGMHGSLSGCELRRRPADGRPASRRRRRHTP
jgi:hypothetical protein